MNKLTVFSIREEREMDRAERDRLKREKRKPSEISTLEEQKRSHQKFILENLKEIAAFAWESYLEEGRGIIVFDLRNLDHWQVEKDGGEKDKGVETLGRYLGESAVLEKKGEWWDKDMARMVKGYNPGSEAVVVFMWGDRGVSAYKFICHPFPPEAYQELRGRPEYEGKRVWRH
jgi:hypothetical protein